MKIFNNRSKIAATVVFALILCLAAYMFLVSRVSGNAKSGASLQSNGTTVVAEAEPRSRDYMESGNRLIIMRWLRTDQTCEFPPLDNDPNTKNCTELMREKKFGDVVDKLQAELKDVPVSAVYERSPSVPWDSSEHVGWILRCLANAFELNGQWDKAERCYAFVGQYDSLAQARRFYAEGNPDGVFYATIDYFAGAPRSYAQNALVQARVVDVCNELKGKKIGDLKLNDPLTPIGGPIAPLGEDIKPYLLRDRLVRIVCPTLHYEFLDSWDSFEVQSEKYLEKSGELYLTFMELMEKEYKKEKDRFQISEEEIKDKLNSAAERRKVDYTGKTDAEKAKIEEKMEEFRNHDASVWAEGNKARLKQMEDVMEKLRSLKDLPN